MRRSFWLTSQMADRMSEWRRWPPQQWGRAPHLITTMTMTNSSDAKTTGGCQVEWSQDKSLWWFNYGRFQLTHGDMQGSRFEARCAQEANWWVVRREQEGAEEATARSYNDLEPARRGTAQFWLLLPIGGILCCKEEARAVWWTKRVLHAARAYACRSLGWPRQGWFLRKRCTP